MQNKKKTFRTAIIGKLIRIEDAANKTLIGINGKIIDETKNMITIQTTKGIKKIIKNQATIMIDNKAINGKTLIGRIEARIKQ